LFTNRIAAGQKPVRTAAASILLAVAATGCSQTGVPSSNRFGPIPTAAPAVPTPPTTTSASPNEATMDYTHLLLQDADVSTPEDTFTTRSSNADPNGITGASRFFVNAHDTRAISDSILLYPDAATASTTLRQAAGSLGTMVSGGSPRRSPVGTDGTVISGSAPDGSKAVTLLLFTEGRALVRLEFDSATGDTTSNDYVDAVGRMQQIALRIGLADAA
jgi:hypothetical protein